MSMSTEDLFLTHPRKKSRIHPSMSSTISWSKSASCSKSAMLADDDSVKASSSSCYCWPVPSPPSQLIRETTALGHNCRVLLRLTTTTIYWMLQIVHCWFVVEQLISFIFCLRKQFCSSNYFRLKPRTDPTKVQSNQGLIQPSTDQTKDQSNKGHI